ncbi:ABC transporter substrate-binding protein [Phenylobacterium sp.]|uniref:ABC transporter substrate-binding protein n=1 Tax=Phenylobacterium sp. TaxID=1871053 RepID=UPI002FC61484
MSLPLTGADALGAAMIKNGAQLAIDEANAAGGVEGYRIKSIVLDSGTATAGQHDPAQAARNARKLASDPSVIAHVGPQMSAEGKAMSPIFSAASLATITPTATNPDLTSPDPKFVAQFRPNGKAVFFRTVTTDALQGPSMANYFADTLKVKTVYLIDDASSYGVGISDAFAKQAKLRGLRIVGHDQINPKSADYTSVLTAVRQAGPHALYYGGSTQAGVKLVRQAYDIIPRTIKGGGDGMYNPEYLQGAGFPAAEGWYVTIASPNLLVDPAAKATVEAFKARYGYSPDNSAITAYDAALVAIDAIRRVARSGQQVNRANVRDAIQSTRLKTLQGTVVFDANGDLVDKVTSVLQIHRDPAFPASDIATQYRLAAVVSAGVPAPGDAAPAMGAADLLLQQVINGLSLGAMYALLALGFSIVYGILQLINFAHFNVFMVGSFVGLWLLQALGVSDSTTVLTGLPLAGVLLAAFAGTLAICGALGVLIERVALRPLRGVRGAAAMISTIGVSYILYNLVLLMVGADTKSYPNPIPRVTWQIGGAVLELRQLLVWGGAFALMLGLHHIVRRTRMGKAMQATAQDEECARMMGVEVDRVIMLAFFLGSALAGAAGLIFGLYYGFTGFAIGYSAGMRAFTAAVLGGIGNIGGAMVGGLLVGLIETLSSQFISARWTDAIIFSILILLLVLKPNGLFGAQAPQKS